MFNEDFVNATGPTPASGTCPITQAAEVFLAKIWAVDPKATLEVAKPDLRYPYPVFVLSSENLMELALKTLQSLPIKCPTYPGLGFADALGADGNRIHLLVPPYLLHGYVSALEAPSVMQPA